MRTTAFCMSFGFIQLAGYALDSGWYGAAMANLLCAIGASSVYILEK